MKRSIFFALVVILLGAMIISACASEPEEDDPEEMDFSGEVSGGGAAPDDEEGFDFSEDEVEAEDEDEIDISEEEAEESGEFDDITCLAFPNYVPCGTFLVGFNTGTMTCPNLTRNLDASPNEFLTLIPQQGGEELFAVATGSGEGTLSLLDVLEDVSASLYSGPLTNFEGRIINFSFSYFSEGDGTGTLLAGELKVVIDNPAGTGGQCTILRTFDAPQQ